MLRRSALFIAQRNLREELIEYRILGKRALLFEKSLFYAERI
jgi:hypothetical protein